MAPRFAYFVAIGILTIVVITLIALVIVGYKNLQEFASQPNPWCPTVLCTDGSAPQAAPTS
jgi:hypothetical protein